MMTPVRPSASQPAARQGASGCVGLTFGRLATEPRRIGKPLVGELTGLLSARRGDYRIIYEIDEEASVVLLVP